MDGGTEAARHRHDMLQPLNIALLACSNLRRRIQPVLADDDAIYLDAKVQVIEQQISRLSEMLDAAPKGGDQSGSPDRKESNGGS